MSSSDQRPPAISPYLFPLLLAGFGVWFFYDGWLTSDPKMLEHQLFNRLGSAILLPWAVIDFYRTHRRERRRAAPPAEEGPSHPS
jgi:hypothetical protein